MTITKRIGISYALIASVSAVLVAWLGYHEFVQEPRVFAAHGVSELHADTSAELSTVCFFGMMPVLLGVGWWWIHRVLAPLRALCETVEKIDFHNLRRTFPQTGSDDEVAKLSTAFGSMAERLDQSFRRIHEFTLHASHELKTPLTVMSLHLETALREKQSLSPEQTEWMTSQIDEVNRLTRIVDSLTLLTKADAGLVELKREPVQLGQLVEEAFDDAQILGQSRNLEVVLDKRDDAVVDGDRHRLRQLLLILTDNAVKYNRPGGTIHIAMSLMDETAELQITNTGAGYSTAKLENVFTPFVRGENARGLVEGCGLGLAIAEWIVHAHGGSIQLIAEGGEKITALVRIPARLATGQLAGEKLISASAS